MEVAGKGAAIVRCLCPQTHRLARHASPAEIHCQRAMYSLLVSSAASDTDLGSFAFDRSRFAEYTADEISAQLKSLSREAVASLRSWPCLFVEEGKGNESARVVQVSQIGVKRYELTISLRAVEGAPVLTNDVLWRMRRELDIADFEFSRNHWAIKEKDLIGILASAGYPVRPEFRASFPILPLPAPKRQDLVRAREVIRVWGHTQIDDLLLEAGIDGIRAGRDLGSRADRANAIISYVIENPGATTAENSLFSAFLVEHALQGHSEGQADPMRRQVVSPSVTSATPSASSIPVAAPATQPGSGTRSPNRVFVVHGRNEDVRVTVTTYLQSLGLEAIVLHEQPNMGRHLLTKFVEEAELVTFAVVLMTDDDVGSVKDGRLAPRARQNVILELGYFLSHLGQKNVCALISPGLETPSDFDGIVYISVGSDLRWKHELLRELRAAGMPVNS